MPQETTYPDPEQLKTYSRDPMPFHEITTSGLEITEDGTLRFPAGNVEYRFDPTYINVETAPEEWERVCDVSDFDMDHCDAFDRAGNLEVGEDYICATGPTDARAEPAQFDAYWLLGTVTITHPDSA